MVAPGPTRRVILVLVKEPILKAPAMDCWPSWQDRMRFLTTYPAHWGIARHLDSSLERTALAPSPYARQPADWNPLRCSMGTRNLTSGAWCTPFSSRMTGAFDRDLLSTSECGTSSAASFTTEITFSAVSIRTWDWSRKGFK